MKINYIISKVLFSFVILCFVAACNQHVGKSQPEIKEDKTEIAYQNKFVLLDSALASKVIIVDTMENFFDLITPTDVELQLKRTYVQGIRAAILKEYQFYLKRDVRNFNESETNILNGILKEIQIECEKLDPDFFPNQVELIKVTGKLYGNSVYYTRQNTIIIPENELKSDNIEKLKEVLYHELFHIYSRFNPAFRDKAYAMIGYKKLDGKLVFSEPLNQTLLVNPDGVDMNYYIEVTDPITKNKVKAIPVISSNELHYSSTKPNFFDYLEFGIYPIVNSKENPKQYVIQCDKNGKSTINLNLVPDFFTQIKDNTNYIIHPDEVLADNFAFLISYIEKGKKGNNLKEFSPEGLKLINELKKLIQEN